MIPSRKLPLDDDLRERIAICEVGVGRKPDLGLPIGAAGPRPLDRDPAGAEGDLAALVAMAHGAPLGDVHALRADDFIEFLLHQLAEHSGPDADRQRHEPFLGGTGERAGASCTRTGRALSLVVATSATGTFSFTAVPP